MSLESNKLIAEFLGMKHEHTFYGQRWTSKEFSKVYTTSELDFDSDWNLLMYIVTKIESLGAVDVIIGRYDCIITADDGVAYFKDTLSKGRTKIEMVYESVVEFIKWYNQSK